MRGSKTMKIRKLELKDMEQSFKLLNELYYNKIKYNTYKEKFINCLKENDFYGIVAEKDGVVLGVLTSRIITRLVKSKDILFIDDLIVSKEYRRQGVGNLLLQSASNFAKEKNCGTIELKSYITNKNAHQFYENFGFKKLHYAFKKKI